VIATLAVAVAVSIVTASPSISVRPQGAGRDAGSQFIERPMHIGRLGVGCGTVSSSSTTSSSKG
jgi:hypothetical protein